MKSSVLFSLALTPLLTGTTSVLATAADCGCGKQPPKGVEADQSVNRTLTSASGVSPRKYRIHLPPLYDVDKKYPLILSYHGRGKDAKSQEELSQFSNASYGFEGIAVYPEGVPVRVVAAEIKV